VYKEQEEIRRKMLEEQAFTLAQSRVKSEAGVKDAKQSLAGETAAARASLVVSSDALADRIVASLMTGRAG
jgi:hypothetical protein